MTSTFQLANGRVVEAADLVGDRTFVAAEYGGGGQRAIGRVLAYCDAPQFLIETVNGERIWWRADMTRPADADVLASRLHAFLDSAGEDSAGQEIR